MLVNVLYGWEGRCGLPLSAGPGVQPERDAACQDALHSGPVEAAED